MNPKTLTFAATMTAAASCAIAAGPRFEQFGSGFGHIPVVQAVSGDGLTIGGGSVGSWGGPVFWRDPQIPITVTTYNGGYTGFIRALTPDGRIGVGVIGYDPIVQAGGAFVWDLVLRQARSLPSTFAAAAYGVTPDGAVIVGTNGRRAVAWDSNNQRVELMPGQYATAVGVSADGARIVGYFGYDTPVRAFVWTAATGAVQLPSPAPGSTHDRALAITPDGSTIVGYSGNHWLSGALVRWKLDARGTVTSTAVLSPSGVCFSTGDLLDSGGYFTAAVSADGSVIGGTVDERALVWTEGHGLLDLTAVYEEFFPQSEVDPHPSPYAVKGISADGRTLVGLFIDAQQDTSSSWKLTLPPRCDADANFDGVADTRDLVRLLGSFGQTVPFGTRGDSNGDGFVDTSDLIRLLAGFGHACPG